jgi:hypothetical protein
MSVVNSVAKIGEVIAGWLNPDRKEKAILREAIDAAEQLLMILRKQGRYAKMTAIKLKAYEAHYQKRFDSWRDGQT